MAQARPERPFPSHKKKRRPSKAAVFYGENIIASAAPNALRTYVPSAAPGTAFEPFTRSLT
ncbi:hypothetical protein AD944_04635 [Acetobacter tropicalis]|uniref:Uncharacterized protein n=1 Tax=Acetobacter tropicalis TaxID=104102 RepID=A0A149TVM3_9PROT|nr:hypothetical protein AD944_04635 [Acetobacter tropicalis]KXV57139.1 hypothetical protein AD947_09365 [Acetobacter tropicalis]